MKSTRREWIVQTSMGIAGTIWPVATQSVTETCAPEQVKRMNLLFITVDDMNWSIPGFMGGKKDLTPGLDALAE
jgi:hypothetical protein